jgi:hypothetical protein
LGQPWVPDFWVDIRGSPHKNRQPWVPATSFLFCVRWATRPNCQPLTLLHLESDGGPTTYIAAAVLPHCILPARNLETLTIFFKLPTTRLVSATVSQLLLSGTARQHRIGPSWASNDAQSKDLSNTRALQQLRPSQLINGLSPIVSSNLALSI